MDPTVEVSLSRVLAAAEDATPVQAVEAVTRELGAALHARSVSFLVADLSGRALVRLAHTPLTS
ncbi:serine/threonine-protein phosphatase, partial [Actinoplanes sp. NPDC051475]